MNALLRATAGSVARRFFREAFRHD